MAADVRWGSSLPGSAEQVAKGHFVVAGLRRPRLEDGRPVSMPEVIEFTVGGDEVKIPGLDALVTQLSLNEIRELVIPAGTKVTIPPGVAGCKGSYTGTVPSNMVMRVDVELLACRAEVLRRGNGERPSPGHLAVVKLSKSRLRNGGPLAMPKLVKFTVGSGEVIPGLDAAVAEMSLNECAQLTIPPLGGYGASGHPNAGVPSNAALLVEAELLGFV
mmetsp:Transcript_52822/g.113121  ORF Transcript_52822/g.113121 Transcript_52822/m.113121 type:complete len:217 (-) Transcript_52822:72-722(-)